MSSSDVKCSSTGEDEEGGEEGREGEGGEVTEEGREEREGRDERDGREGREGEEEEREEEEEEEREMNGRVIGGGTRSADDDEGALCSRSKSTAAMAESGESSDTHVMLNTVVSSF